MRAGRALRRRRPCVRPRAARHRILDGFAQARVASPVPRRDDDGPGERCRVEAGLQRNQAPAGLDRDIDPCAAALSRVAERVAGENGAGTQLAPPYDARDIFAAARAGDPLARQVVDEEARRIALHIVPIASVADVALVVIGGGIGANGDLLLRPVRALLAEWLPYPPRVEISSLGDAAVLTGALAVGLRAARDNVFVNRNRAVAG